jgi:hypothetical protein
MKAFVQRFADKILGVISGFDRMRFRGSLRLLASVGGTGAWLHAKGILLKDFLPFAEKLTKQIREQSKQIAEEAGRPIQYLEGFCNKEELVRGIRQQQGVADNGLIAVLSTLETCRSYDIYRNRETKQIDLRRRPRKALHHYFYFDDGQFGLTQVRLMTWFPFDVHVVLNGREWLARDLDKAQIGYLRRDNCFVNISDFEQAQKLADKHPKIGWPGQLERLLRRVHPLHRQFFAGDDLYDPLSYYWSSDQTEWATDVAFRDSASLADLYPTLNDAGGLKVYRAKQSDPRGPKQWLPLRKSVADLSRRSRLSQKSNQRYLESLSAFDSEVPLKQLTDKLCGPVQIGNRRYRGLRPFDPADAALLETVSRGEFTISGFRNRDIRLALEGEMENAADRRRASSRISRKLSLLRAHGLIKKIPHTHRYELTLQGRTTITALLSARNATPKQLSAAA